MDSGHQIKKDPKAAIRLVTPGITRDGAEKILGNCVKTFRSTYPDAVVRYAIASELVRQVMAGEGVGAGELVESSKWDDAKNLADVYVTWRGHAYDRKLKGEKMAELLKERLARLDVTVKNHNSRELDILDNDNDFMYHGGMVAGVKTYGDRDLLSVVGDSSDPDHLKTRTLGEKGRFIFRSRILNPKWLEGLKPHGYRGAQELSAMVDYAFGWDATADIMDDWMYQAVTDNFLFDEKTKQWIEENKPYALRQMAGRLLEAVQRGMWDADEETAQKLTDIYLEAEDMMEGMGE